MVEEKYPCECQCGCPVEKLKFVPAENFDVIGYVAKNQSGEVNVSLQFTKKNEEVIQDEELLGVMPEGYRPNFNENEGFPASYFGPFAPGIVIVHSDGKVTARTDSKTARLCFANMSYYVDESGKEQPRV